jgi:hypothetical protein
MRVRCMYKVLYIMTDSEGLDSGFLSVELIMNCSLKVGDSKSPSTDAGTCNVAQPMTTCDVAEFNVPAKKLDESWILSGNIVEND